MRRPKFQRYLEFESMESMELMSGVGIAAPHELVQQGLLVHPMAHRGQVSTTGVSLSLSGTLRGTYRAVNGGTQAKFNGKGQLASLGNAQVNGTVSLVAPYTQRNLKLSLGKRGQIFITLTGVTPTGEFKYEVTGGTKSFAHDTGNGVIAVLISETSATRGQFSMTLVP
jgi:hypothetical protein